MGCLWSSEQQRCIHCNRKAINGLLLVNHRCDICRYIETRQQPQQQLNIPDGPYYGEYCCKSCKRYWTSRSSWPNKYQQCKNCRSPNYPVTCRKLNMNTDMNLSEKRDHEKDLCQKCQELGYNCSKLIEARKPGRRNYRSRSVH